MKNRIIYFDYLRALSILAVIILHIAAQNWYEVSYRTFEWKLFNLIDSMMRWAVPVFVMISGALFLEKEIDIKKLYGKNIFRLITAFIFWSIIYAVIKGGTKEEIIVNAITGHFHMWFIPMITGIYILTPILKEIVKNEKAMVYFVTIMIVFEFMIPQVLWILNDIGGHKIQVLSIAFLKILNKTNLSAFAGYISYFIIGYWLNHMNLNKKHRVIFYVLGIFGMFFTMGMTYGMAVLEGAPTETYYKYISLNVLLESIALFIFVKYNAEKWEKINKLVIFLSECSFGVYLIHVLVLEQFKNTLHINTLSFNPLLSMPFLVAVIFIISLGMVMIIKKIPVLNKYII